MTRSSSCHLLDILAKVPDPRHKKGKRHPLVSILALIVIGLMSNHKGYTSIATWARSPPELAKALGFRSPKTPCAATLHNLLKRLDVMSLEVSLTKWAFSKLEDFQVLKTQHLEGVAIDQYLRQLSGLDFSAWAINTTHWHQVFRDIRNKNQIPCLRM